MKKENKTKQEIKNYLNSLDIDRLTKTYMNYCYSSDAPDSIRINITKIELEYLFCDCKDVYEFNTYLVNSIDDYLQSKYSYYDGYGHLIILNNDDDIKKHIDIDSMIDYIYDTQDTLDDDNIEDILNR